MAIIEAGIIFAGLPIVKVNYYDEQSTDTLLTAGLLAAIQSFAGEVFGDDTDLFKMKKYTIFLQRTALKEPSQEVTIYTICDSVDRPGMIKEIMTELLDKFKERYPEILLGCTDVFKPFESVITKCIGDLRFRPEDRLKKVFF